VTAGVAIGIVKADSVNINDVVILGVPLVMKNSFVTLYFLTSMAVLQGVVEKVIDAKVVVVVKTSPGEKEMILLSIGVAEDVTMVLMRRVLGVVVVGALVVKNMTNGSVLMFTVSGTCIVKLSVMPVVGSVVEK
jgi:hypothetical protein